MYGENHPIFKKVAKTDYELLNAEISTSALNLKGHSIFIKPVLKPEIPSTTFCIVYLGQNIKNVSAKSSLKSHHFFGLSHLFKKSQFTSQSCLIGNLIKLFMAVSYNVS
jgi:hypothetical protein